jgi:photosystem II stability/assembly factor-like uncharacterized protein
MRCNLVRIGVAGLWLICALPQSAIVAEGRPPATAAEVATPPVMTPGDKLPAIVTRNREYFARRGSGRGTGYRQYVRGLEFAAPRLYPSGDLVNTTALTWLNHFRAVRSGEMSAGTAASVAAGVGSGNWHLMGPLQGLEPGDVGDPGRINAVAFDPADARTIYIGSPLGGLWRTQDGGASWTSLTDGLPMIGVTDIAVDPLMPATIYLLTGDGEGGELNHGPPSIGVLKSVDAGLHWMPTGLIWKSDQREYAHRIAIHPRTPSVLLVAGTAGLFRSADAGATWTRVTAGDLLNPFWDVLFHPGDPAIVYAASRTDVYRSLDAGQSWTRLRGGLPAFTDRSDPNFSNRIRLAVTPASADTLYVLYGSRHGFTNGLYRSDDGGNTFEKRSSTSPYPKDPNAPLPIDLSSPNILGYDANDFMGQSDYDLSMAVSPTDADRVHVGGVDTWRSDDGGRIWTATSRWWWDRASKPNYVHADIHSLVYRDGVLYAGTDGGLYASSDGGEGWSSITRITRDFSIALVYHVCGTPQDPDLFYYGAQDNGTYRLFLNGKATRVWGGDGMMCQIDPRDSTIVYSSYVQGEIYRSDRGGKGGENEWAKIRPTIEGQPVPGPWLTPYILAPENPDHLYACYADLWFSPDRGKSWRNLSDGALGASTQCQQVAVSPADPNTIYVAKDAEWDAMHLVSRGDPRTPFLGGGGVFRSSDGGRTWQTITGELPLAEAAITNMAVSPTDPRRVWITFSGYTRGVKVFATRDAGSNWTNVSAGLPNLPVNAVAARRDASNGIYVGLDSGVYYRDDRLDSWVPFADGLPHVVIMSLMIDEGRSRLIAGTFGRGVWMSDIISPCTENCAQSPGGARNLTAARPRLPELRGIYTGPADIFQ